MDWACNTPGRTADANIIGGNTYVTTPTEMARMKWLLGELVSSMPILLYLLALVN
jgi:hypothetical protein